MQILRALDCGVRKLQAGNTNDQQLNCPQNQGILFAMVILRQFQQLCGRKKVKAQITRAASLAHVN